MRKICEKIAQERHTTAEEVYRSMQEAINMAYHGPQSENVRSLQAQVPRCGGVPTPEEMIAYLTGEIKKTYIKI